MMSDYLVDLVEIVEPYRMFPDLRRAHDAAVAGDAPAVASAVSAALANRFVRRTTYLHSDLIVWANRFNARVVPLRAAA
jgi:hypothetical protein